MTERTRFTPFTKGKVDSYQLNNEALVLVLCQLRWPSLANLQNDMQLQALLPDVNETMLSNGYPIYTQAKNINYVVTPEGITPNESGTIHQWTSPDDSWHISLSTQFMSLFSTKYSSYKELRDRLVPVLSAVSGVLTVPAINRVGVRYVNRIEKPEDMSNLASLIKPQILGYRALGHEYLQTSMNQAVYAVDGNVLQVRSGILPPNQNPDPSINSVANESWVLDLDASRESKLIMNIDNIMSVVSSLSDIDYDYFKFITTREFVDRFSDKKGL